MKKLRSDIDHWLDRLDKNWDAMPVKRQRQIILHFLAAYALLTAAVIFNVCRGKAQRANSPAVEHIHPPFQAGKESSEQLEDSLKPLLKK